MVNTYHLCVLAALVASTATSVVAAPQRRNAVQLQVRRPLSHPIESADCVLQARGNGQTKVCTLSYYHCHFTILECDCGFIYRYIY